MYIEESIYLSNNINIFIDIYIIEGASPRRTKGCGVIAGVYTLYKLKDTLDTDLF